MSNELDRRRFLKTALLTGAGLGAVPGVLLARSEKTAGKKSAAVAADRVPRKALVLDRKNDQNFDKK